MGEFKIIPNLLHLQHFLYYQLTLVLLNHGLQDKRVESDLFLDYKVLKQYAI